MTPVPEPAGDIRAQITAVLDPAHPKRACFMVPLDAARLRFDALPQGAYAAVRPEGTLVTTDRTLAEAFDEAPSETTAFDTAMAEILDLAEPKHLMSQRCHHKPEIHARAVQARDAREHVVIETFASPLGFLAACDAMQAHVPPGGQLVTIGAAMAISRRVAMRWVEG